MYALLADGGEISMKMEKTPFADRFAMLRDKFGTSWMLLHQPEYRATPVGASHDRANAWRVAAAVLDRHCAVQHAPSRRRTGAPLDLATAPVPPGARRIATERSAAVRRAAVPSTKGPHPVVIVIHGGCWLAELGSMDPRAVR